jgi:hypothetical protein
MCCLTYCVSLQRAPVARVQTKHMATVKVDLPKKLVTITTKPGKTLSNVKFKEVVTCSGYTMGKIVRQK